MKLGVVLVLFAGALSAGAFQRSLSVKRGALSSGAFQGSLSVKSGALSAGAFQGSLSVKRGALSTGAFRGSLSVKRVVLQHDKTGLLLCRTNRGPGVDPIEVHKSTPDGTCEFDVTENSEGTYSLRADNGRYLSRVTRNGTDVVEAAESSIGQSTTIFVHEYEKKLLLQGDNKVYWSRSNSGAIVLVLPNYSYFTVARIHLMSEAKYAVINTTHHAKNLA